MADDAVLRALDILTPVFETSGLEELEVEAGEIQVRLARAVAPSTAAPLSAAAPAPPLAATPPTSVSPFGEPAPGRRFVTAPLTGVWYGAPSPGARPYLAVDAEEVAVCPTEQRLNTSTQIRGGRWRTPISIGPRSGHSARTAPCPASRGAHRSSQHASIPSVRRSSRGAHELHE